MSDREEGEEGGAYWCEEPEPEVRGQEEEQQQEEGRTDVVDRVDA